MIGVYPRLAFGDLLAHVGNVEVGDRTRLDEDLHRRFGIVGVDVDLQGGFIADHQDRITDLLESADELARVEAAAGNDEVRAVLEAAVFMLGMGDLGSRVMLDLGQVGILAPERGQHTGQDQDQSVAAGIDHP